MTYTIIQVSKAEVEQVTLNSGAKYVRASPCQWFICAADNKLLSCAAVALDLEMAYNKFMSGYRPVIVLDRRTRKERRTTEFN